jgi:hypothetical protein
LGFNYEAKKRRTQADSLSPLHATDFPEPIGYFLSRANIKTWIVSNGRAVIFVPVKFKNIFILVVLATFLCGASQAGQGAPKPVMVHYMPWFVSQPYSGSWGWHWTMNHFNPNLTNANGEQEIASWYYPLTGPYDSLDSKVLEYHVLLMKLAGIDGVIVDWYGQDNFNDYGINNQRTLALFNWTRKAGLKFSLCYEDATIQAEINGNYIAAAAAIAHAQQTMLYAQTNFFTDASFLRLSNAPVILNFGPQYFKNNSDWTSIFSVLDATNRPAFFTEDNRLSPVGAGAFDWPPMWMTGGGTNLLTPAQLQGYLANFQQTAAGWPNFVSSAFPRFHDIYAQAGVGASYGQLDDANGSTLTSTLSRAMTNNSAIVQLVTWNDFGEGTIIEPTLDYGYRDLGIVQDLRRQYLDANFSYHTNDLAMALRFYNLRKQYGNNAAISGELNRTFTNIVSGQVSTANLQLTGMESNHPVIYNLSYGGSQLQFLIGGYVASSVQVQMSTNLIDWQIVQTFPVSASLSIFSTSNALDVCRFFKVQ